MVAIGSAVTVTPARCSASMNAVRANVAVSVSTYTLSVGSASAAIVPVMVSLPSPSTFGFVSRVPPPASTVSTSTESVHGATAGISSPVAGSPAAAPGVISTSMMFWLMIVGVTGCLSSSPENSRSSMITSPLTVLMPDAFTCSASSLSPVSGSSVVSVAPGIGLASLWSRFV